MIINPYLQFGSSLVPYWGGGELVGNLDSSANWQEMSGLATPHLLANANYLWACSDAPANMIACINKNTSANAGVLTLTGQTAMIDLEDIESATVGGVNYLYGMDFGNNPNSADSRGSGIDMRIFRIVEPTITGSNISTSNFIEINCAFPGVNGPTTSRDCEASIVDKNGKIWIITKRDAIQKVYSLAHQATYTGTQTLVYEGVMTALPASTTVALTTTPCYAVDAAINPDNSEIHIKNYSNTYFFPMLPGETVIQALQKPLVVKDYYVGGGSTSPKASAPSQEPQGEGLAYGYDGRDLFSTSEYNATEGSTSTTYPLRRYDRIPVVPTRWEFQQGVLPTAGYTGCKDTTIWDTNPGTNYGADPTFTVDTAPGVETDQRKALLGFDISAIPTSKTVYQIYYELYIAVEGQGWKFHKMLVPWTSSSTYTSLGGGVDNDGTKAAVAYDCQNGLNLDTVQGVTSRNNIPRATGQDWVSNPSNNNGHLIEQISSATGDGIQFGSAEAVVAAQRPKLVVITD